MSSNSYLSGGNDDGTWIASIVHYRNNVPMLCKSWIGSRGIGPTDERKNTNRNNSLSSCGNFVPCFKNDSRGFPKYRWILSFDKNWMIGMLVQRSRKKRMVPGFVSLGSVVGSNLSISKGNLLYTFPEVNLFVVSPTMPSTSKERAVVPPFLVLQVCFFLIWYYL